MTRSRTLTTGLVLCAVLGVVDVVSVAGLGSDEGPPPAIIVLGAVAGIVTLIGVRLAWKDQRGGIAAVVASRVISALSGIPAFFVDDVPDWVPVAVGAGIALTAVALSLLYVGLRQGPAAATPSTPAGAAPI